MARQVKHLGHIVHSTLGRLEAYSSTRGGSWSPISWFFVGPDGKRYTEYALHRKYGWFEVEEWSAFRWRQFNANLKKYYNDDMIKDLLLADNPIFKQVKDFDAWQGTTLPLPNIGE